MHHIDYCEFYITNVCNLSCPGCNRFNNYKFTGYQSWSDYADFYKQWSKEVTFNSIGLLGGEPLLNPSVLDWITGLRQLWNVPLKIVTNGFQLHKVKNLYETLQNDKMIHLNIGIHNKNHEKEIFEIIKTFLQSPIKIKHHHENKYRLFSEIEDANRVKVKVEINWWFHQGSLIPTEGGFRLHESDPVKAHDNCHMKTCHHFINGKLYKCGVVALLPEFAKQHKLFLTEEDQKLMDSYKPLSIDDSIERKSTFINELHNLIPQCKFCPETYKGDIIFAKKKSDVKE